MTTDDSTTRLMKTVVATGVMLVIGWLVAPTLSHWHSRQLADRLAARIADAKDAQVKVPLRQLADLGAVAIEPLIVAAASEREAVASIARQIIDEKLATWEMLAENSPSEAIAALATSLATHIEAFGPAGKQWAEQLALTMIELTDHLPARQVEVLLEHSSRVLAAVPPRGSRLRTLTTRAEITDLSEASRLAAPEPQLAAMTRSSESSLERLARMQPSVPPEAFGSLTRELPRRREASGLISQPLDWSPRWSGEFQSQSPPHLATPSENDLPKSTLEAIPKPSTVDNGVVDIPTPQDMATRAATLRQLASEELLLQLRKASFYEAGIIRTVLVERGFADAELALRQQLASPNVNDRLRLVEEVTQLPATTARRLLRWLLEDENGDVRLQALTALATTSAPDLNELARELAVRDEDPRVAKLASRLLKQVR